jgi:hypothetical protein
MKLSIVLAIFYGSFPALRLTGQTISPPAIEWQRSFGGTNNESAYCVRQTSDSGFIVGGIAGPGVGGNKTSLGFGSADYWVVRLDRNGDKLWVRCFGGDNHEVLFDLLQTDDGGFILVGWSDSSNTGNKSSTNSGSFGTINGWLVRLDANGNKLWDKGYGNANVKELYSVQQMANGGFVLAGAVSSSVPPDWLVLWIDANGNVLKERRFGGDRSESNPSIRLMPDGGYVIAGYSTSPPSGNKTSPLPGGGGPDLWVVRLDANGDKLWDQSYGGIAEEQWASVEPTADGGFVLATVSQSPVSGNKTIPPFGMDDIWVVRANAAGEILWDKSFGGNSWEFGGKIYQTADGGFILGGASSSGTNGNKTSPFFGGPMYQWVGGDFWLVRLDANGNKLWDQSFGGSGSEGIESLAQTSDGGFILAGGSQSPMDGNKTTQGFGNGDFWVIKLGPDALSLPPGLRALPQSTADIRTLGFRLLLEGVSNQNYVVEASTDFITWSATRTNRLTATDVEFLDASATNLSRRFYRARPVP